MEGEGEGRVGLMKSVSLAKFEWGLGFQPSIGI